MFRVYTFEDTVRIDPAYFKLELEEAAAMVLRDRYERRVDPDIGIILSIHNPKEISEGKVIPGDGAAYHKLKFDALTYLPEVNEVVEGEVSEVVEFGAFVRIGPHDGLVHLSQITSDFITFDKKLQSFVGKESKKTLKKGDVVTAKISVVSMKQNLADTKIGLTMRPEGLGREEWLKAKPAEKKEKAEKPEKEKKEKK